MLFATMTRGVIKHVKTRGVIEHVKIWMKQPGIQLQPASADLHLKSSEETKRNSNQGGNARSKLRGRSVGMIIHSNLG